MATRKQYASIEKVVEQLYDSWGFININEEEVAELIWRAVGKIGVPEAYKNKYVEVEIADWKGKLPHDFYDIMDGGIREHDSGNMMRETSDVFFEDPEKIAETPDIIPEDWDPVTGKYYHTTVPSSDDPQYYTYKIEGGIITVGFRQGNVDIKYKAFPIDIKTGLPLIADDPVYLNGIVDYIAYIMARKMMLKDELSERKFHIIEQTYFFSIGAAQTNTLIPSRDKMETLMNMWKSDVPHYDHFNTGFKYLGSRE